MAEPPILAWLLAYPASSARELAAAFTLHAATVYRALTRMQHAGLVQRLSGYGGEARFLLTPHGRARLSSLLSVDADHLARVWQRGLATPTRLVLRLMTIDRLHTFARQFFQHAPVAQARQGHAAVVRWHVVRDWRTQRAITERHAFSVQAHATLAWTVEDSRDFASSALATLEQRFPMPQWHAAFVLLESGLCDRDLIAARLRTLLRYRASPERCQVASSFPPVLILVKNERQAEIWRRVTREVARSARGELLAGAIAILSEGENPWQWGWRDLATGASIRLTRLLAPLPEAALPRGVMTHIAQVQEVMRACDDAAGRETLPLPHAKAPAALPQVMPPRDRALLTLLARVPALSADELAAVRGTPEQPLATATADRALRDLHRHGWVRRELVVQERQAQWRWHLTDGGLRQVAAIHDAPLLHLGRVVAAASDDSRAHAILEPRDLFLVRRQGAHLAGVYGVVAAFHRAAQATQGAITVAWWDVGDACARTYWYQGVQRNLRPDAELELAGQANGTPRRMRLWLEYDRGTMGRRDLARKMSAYAAYWASKEWAADGYAALPRLLFIVPETGQEARVREACVERLAGARLRVLATTVAHLEAATPFGRIWRQLLPVLPEGEQAERRALWE